MANKLYPKGKRDMMKGLLDMNGGNVRAILIDSDDYTYDDAHDNLDDIPSGARVAVSSNLSGKTFGNDGSFDSDDPVFAGVTGDQLEAIVLYLHTGTESTSKLIAFFDTGITGMPLTPDGNNVQVTVDAAGWFTL
jgi:hypothetical protein